MFVRGVVGYGLSAHMTVNHRFVVFSDCREVFS